MLTLSLHADPDRGAYPFYCGYAAEEGTGAGQGCNCNFPLPAAVDDDHYLQVLHQALARIRQHRAQYLVVSVGLDIYEQDPLGDFAISLEGFARIGHCLAELGLPTLLVQEGGYNVGQVGKAMANLLAAFD